MAPQLIPDPAVRQQKLGFYCDKTDDAIRGKTTEATPIRVGYFLLRSRRDRTGELGALDSF